MAVYDDVMVDIQHDMADLYETSLDLGYITTDDTDDYVVNYMYDIMSDEYFRNADHWDVYTDQYRSIEDQMKAYDAIKDDFGILEYLYNKDYYDAQSEYKYGYIGMYVVLYKYYLEQDLFNKIDTFVSRLY